MTQFIRKDFKVEEPDKTTVISHDAPAPRPWEPSGILYLIGLPGSGKSALLELAAKAGFPVFDADARVAALYEPGADGWQLLRRRYGERFVAGEKSRVDKKALFEACLESDKLRRELGELVHPLVEHRLREFWKENFAQRAGFAEIPLLFEVGWQRGRGFDAVIGVAAKESTRLQRLCARGLSAPTAQAVTAWHWPQDEKLKGCQYIIDNDCELDDLTRDFSGVLAALAALRRARMRRFALWLLELLAGGRSLPPPK